MFVQKFEVLLSDPDTKTSVRIRLYQLIAIFLELDYSVISEALSELPDLM
jgi:hypothetical protein